MTLDETIRHCEELAEQEECFINYPHSDIILGDLDIESRKHFVAEQRQLAEWLKELKEAKRLLKAAIDDMNANNFCCKFDSCKVCSKRYSISCNKKFQWHYSDEALKLIGDEPNV